MKKRDISNYMIVSQLKSRKTTESARIYNLRKELARQLWLARSGNIDTAEASHNIRTLASLCVGKQKEQARLLIHKVMTQITKKYGYDVMVRNNVEIEKPKIYPVKTRDYLQAVRLGKGMIG